MNVWVPALTPPSQETHHWGLWDHRPCRRHRGRGQGLLPEVAALPSEVQEVGVSEASSGPDCLGGAGSGGSEAWPQLPLPLQPVASWVAWMYGAGKWGWGWVPRAPTGDQLSEPEDSEPSTIRRWGKGWLGHGLWSPCAHLSLGLCASCRLDSVSVHPSVQQDLHHCARGAGLELETL